MQECLTYWHLNFAAFFWLKKKAYFDENFTFHNTPCQTSEMSSGSAASFTKTMPPTPTGSNTEQSPHNELRTEEHGPYAPPELGVIHNVKSALKKTDGSDIAVAGSGIDDKDGGDGGMIHQGEVKKKSLKWDEYAIEEHDLLRGTRMKVRSRASEKLSKQSDTGGGVWEVLHDSANHGQTLGIVTERL